MLLLRFKDHTLSTAYTLGPGVPDVQWYDTSDADMERILEDEERWYGGPRTGVKLNGMRGRALFWCDPHTNLARPCNRATGIFLSMG